MAFSESVTIGKEMMQNERHNVLLLFSGVLLFAFFSSDIV